MLMLLLFVNAVVVHSKTTCKNEKGEPVDWFIVYKLPRTAAPPGNHYAYLDSTNKNFQEGLGTINGTDNAVAHTLQQVYKGDDEGVGHVFYNDMPPSAKFYDHKFGHTKGQVGFDKESGFWITQNVPRFPTEKKLGYGYPNTGMKYGQMMICVTFNADQFQDIGLQLKYIHPHMYSHNLPAAWEKDFEHIHDLISGKYIIREPYARTAPLKSSGGVKFTHFGKTGSWHHDLYHDLVAPSLKTNIITATWQHGAKTNNLGPTCKGDYTVVDVSRVGVTTQKKQYTFKNWDDHSKWVVSTNEKLPYVCVGDINRQYSQFKRGGGTMCVEDPQLWKTFKKLVLASSMCK